ncbi:hypothetical protein KAFR_0J01370 [Kazachstania africana CBS 2517]|uniref:non-specific serine/threonine protein kinase n=1 Tax=Kazachstania africana (strain ATCC 22294 / BCRC 22015 / CBS 2517 / CECT 1963 / NBRC 1671 / NRRL Y-8276) TaxID=1071382 RepID=H2B0Q4_KAZAF|nr:hypothetical protein KAFR_0J01370 [Kazachstania africana CBS 2517]CCF60204.1 hypothetical protein KAFR_0J01370 [Kazachstania africana CBS 2517]
MNHPQIETFPSGQILTVGSHHAKVIKYLTSGGYAQVYKVEISPSDPYINSNIACLKRVIVPDKPSLNTLRAEVDAMKLLKNNRHVVSYIDSHASKSAIYNGAYEVFVLMEFCERGGLIDFMNSRLQHRLTEAEILTIMSHTSQGIAAMHRLQPALLHRDIKIENVLISQNNEYKVCDFGSVCGIVRPPKNQQEFNFVYHDIMKNTTAQYRSPEMLDLSKGLPINEKSDIWALGVFLYKLCYYTTPFEKNGGEAAILQARFQYPSYPMYSDRLKNLIRVMLSKNPSDRPNVCQVLEEVSRLQGIPCPIRNFYLLRAMENNKRTIEQPVQNVYMPTTLSQPSTQMNLASLNDTLPTAALKFNQTTIPPTNQHSPHLLHTQTLPLPTNDHPVAISHVQDKISPHELLKKSSKSLGSTGTSNKNVIDTSAPDHFTKLLHASKNTDLSYQPVTVPTSSSLYNLPRANLSSSPQKSWKSINDNYDVSKRPTNYVDEETQTYTGQSTFLRRTSSNRSNRSISSQYSGVQENTTGSSLVRKLSVKLKNVLTGESIKSRQNTGDSIRSAMNSIRSGFTGNNNNTRSASYDNGKRLSSVNLHMHSAILEQDDSDEFEMPRYNSVSSNTLKDVEEHERRTVNTSSREYYRSQSPVRMSVNREMKNSIQKRVQDLLKNAEENTTATVRTASGYGKYTDYNKNKDEISPTKSRVAQFNQSTAALASLSGKRKKPPVPYKRDSLKPTPPAKPAFLSSRPVASSRVSSNATDMLVDLSVDDIEKDIRRRFPSTVG